MIVLGSQQEGSDCFEGDSGAWVIRDDNKLVGLLWAWDNHQLLFTPIQDVFADIKRRLNAKKIHLPPTHGPGPNLQSFQRISRKHGIRTEKSCSISAGPYLLEQFLATQQAKSQLDLPVAADTEERSGRGDADTITANGQVSSRSPSPVPSLSSSASSLREAHSSRSPSPTSQFQPFGDSVHLADELGISQIYEEPEELLLEGPPHEERLRKCLSLDYLEKLWQRNPVEKSATFPFMNESRCNDVLVVV